MKTFSRDLEPTIALRQPWLTNVTNDLLIASDQGFVSVLVLLDLSAAFNTIDHEILLQRLEQLISIKGTALNWFK